MKLDLGEVDQDIEDMADLCDELLDSGISIKRLTSPIMAFCEAFKFIAHHNASGRMEGRLISEKFIDCPRFHERQTSAYQICMEYPSRLSSVSSIGSI